MLCPECSEPVRGTRCPACGWRAAKPATQATDIRCARCRGVVQASGWCPSCLQYPGNVTPVRQGTCGHAVEASGWCRRCADLTATRMEYRDGKWLPVQRTDRLLDPRENLARMRLLTECVEAGDRLTLVLWAEERAAQEPGIGWEQAVESLRGRDSVPF